MSVYVAEAGSNGLLVDREGRIVVCEPVRRRISRRTLDGKTTVLAETFGGKKFNQPNDVAVDSKNRLYFTDPRYGSREGMELLDESGRPIEGCIGLIRTVVWCGLLLMRSTVRMASQFPLMTVFCLWRIITTTMWAGLVSCGVFICSRMVSRTSRLRP